MQVTTAPTDRDEFGEQRGRRLAPERLDVLETRSACALLVPRAHIGKMDVAEHHAATTLPRQRGERRPKRRVERLPNRRHAHKRHAGRCCLHRDRTHGGGVEAHARGRVVVNVDEPPDTEPITPRAPEREGAVLSA